MKRVALLFLVFVLELIANLALAAPAAAAVQARDAVTLERAVVRLSDVFTGLPKGVDDNIAQAPAPGKQVVYDVTVLMRLAQKYKLDWEPHTGNDRTVITEASTVITAAALRSAITDKIHAAGIKGDVDIAFDGSRPLDLQLPAEASTDFTLDNFDYDAIGKHFRATLTTDAGAMPLSGHVAVRITVPVLTKHLEAGDMISASDIDWVSVPEERAADAISDAGKLAGQQLRHDVAEGIPLRNRDIMPPRLVARGSIVTLKIETPVMQITAQGRALQDGVLGDTVRVNNTQSNRMVEGVVEGPGIVRIQAPQRFAALATGDK